MIIYPKAGYWRLDAYSDNVVTCPNEDACLYSKSFHKQILNHYYRGGQVGNLTNLTGFCDTGYTGNACATCEDGWGKFGSKIFK